MEGQILLMFWRATCLFREAFDASTSSMASFSLTSKVAFVACTAASIPSRVQCFYAPLQQASITYRNHK